MKKCLFISFFLFFLIGCEDVIEVDVPTEAPRLIVDGLIRVDKELEFVPVEIKITESSNFFGEIPVSGLENAVIQYGVPRANAPELFEDLYFSSLAEVELGSGIYVPDPNFSSDQRIRTPMIEDGIVFILSLEHKGRRYFARTPYVPTVPITNLEQGEGTLFNEDDTEIIVSYTDAPDREDFYLFDFGFNNYEVTEDTFYQGQEFKFSYFYDEDLETGREIDISILGADLTFYNYMSQLIDVSRGDFNVFSTPVSTIRGNIFDVTDLDNDEIFDNVNQSNLFPLGYFAVVQEHKASIEIE
ncbi:hypothetical protein GGR42_001021 [Saonia flava]|uniref:DUF4249 family protein n=1 Tax=Saonia flava TaxID=523696 RepID=A0A846R127_9FLAO|nr:DUF4249 family protein [Saonia flava]NJB70559.1 hypothetical protein [Saonia flava]